MTAVPAARVEQVAQRLFDAFEAGTPVEPLTDGDSGFGVEDAYAVQRRLVALHAEAGRRQAGRKIGLTSVAIQRQLGVSEPDYGVLLDSHVFAGGAVVERAEQSMIQPRVEAELAFVLGKELRGPEVTSEMVLANTRALVPVFELIDSRVRDWRIKLADTIADNASFFGVVTGEAVSPPPDADLATVGLVLERDDEILATAAGAAVMGHPARTVAWLANKLATFGDALPAGELILSGSFTAAFDAEPGRYTARFGDGLGSVEVVIR